MSSVALSVVLAACGSDSEETKTSKAASAGSADKTPSGTDVVAKVGPSIVAVKGSDGDYHSHGTGVIIDAERALVLTSNHLTEGAETLTVTINEKQTVKARPLARANCKDIALLGMYPKPDNLVALDPDNASEVRAGDSVIALGYPGLKTKDGKEKLTTTQGRVAAVGANVEITPELPAFEDLFAHQAPLSGGNSGGPMVDSKGRFVGVNMVIPGEETGGLFYAMSANGIRQLYGELSEGERSFYEGWQKYHKCHKQMVRLARSVQVPNHDLPDGAKARREGSAQHSGH